MRAIALDLREYLLLRLNFIIYFLGFSVPLLVPQPQLITGTIINSLFFIASERLNKKALYLVLALPSLGAISRSVLFGPQTLFLFYFLPFIWIGNYLQVNIFALTKQQNYLVRVLSSALIKSILLFVAANIYYRAHVVPQIFITAMGVVQFSTACLGGLLAYFVVQFLKKYE